MVIIPKQKGQRLTTMKAISYILTLATVLDFCLAEVGFKDGILVSYDNTIEVLDGTTGATISKHPTNLSLITRMAVTQVTQDEVTILAADLVQVQGKRSHIHLLHLDNDSLRGTLLKDLEFVDEMAFDSSTNLAYALSASSYKLSTVSIQSFLLKELPLHSFSKGLTIDSCRGEAYWSEWRENGTVIVRYDTENVSSVAVGDIDRPGNLAIMGRHLFWTSRTSDGVEVQQMDLDTLSRKLVCSHSNRKGPRVSIYAMTVGQDAIYWSDWHNSALWKVDLPSRDGECQPKPLRKLESTRPLSIVNLGAVRQSCENVPMAKPSLHQEGVTKAPLSPYVTPLEDQYPQDCTNYCISHDLDESDYAEAVPDLRHGSNCTETSLEIPICKCQWGIWGSRCQVNPCHNFCLNSGKCLLFLNPKTSPECRCNSGFSGDRCQDVISVVSAIDASPNVQDKLDDYLYFYLFVTALVLLALLLILVAAVAFDNWRLRRKIRSQPDVVKKGRTRVFSTGSSRSRSRGRPQQVQDKSYDNPTLNQGCSKDGVVIDLEDCCQMTLCDKPCFEASFRKPTNRKSRPSRKVETGSTFDIDSDTQNLID